MTEVPGIIFGVIGAVFLILAVLIGLVSDKRVSFWGTTFPVICALASMWILVSAVANGSSSG